MRIDLVCDDASPLAPGAPAGAETGDHIAALARALAAAGVAVTVNVRRDAPGLAERAAMCPGVTVRHLPVGPARPVPASELLPLAGLFGARLASAWRAERPDVVHAHGWRSGLAALAGARASGLPVVQSLHMPGAAARRHGAGLDRVPPERVPLERGIIREAHRLIASSHAQVVELVREGADRRRISVVPCGIDPDLFRPDGPREYRRAARPRAVHAGGPWHRAGVEAAIRAIAMIPGAELVIAGGPPRAAMERDADARRLRAVAAELGVADRVQFRGGIDAHAVATLMRSADVVVCTPWFEPFPVAPLRAMACGVPVVVASSGGIVDAVPDGVAGMHVPADRPPRLAAALAELFADRSLRARMGAAGVRLARRRHGWERVGRDTARVYARAVAGTLWAAGGRAGSPVGAHARGPREGALAG